MRRAVFLDRDGTLIQERHFLRREEDVALMPGSASALRMLAGCGLALVVVSNQSGLARGLISPAELALVHARLAVLLDEAGLALDGLYYCPHHPEGSVPALSRVCDCRKPAPGLIQRAASELGLALEGSWVVGDKVEDMELAAAMDLRGLLVRTGYGRASERALPPGRAEAVVEDILAAARHIAAAEGCLTPSGSETP
jgi:D-glycero-D-manno-heptose 1,7-bisphosphate phosphatase